MEIAGNPTWAAVVRVIDDGDECSNGEHGATAQDLADRTAYLKSLVIASQRVAMSVGVDSGGNFTQVLSSNRIYWEQNSVGSAGNLSFQLSGLPIGRQIASVTAYYQNAGNTTLPVTTMPAVALYKRTVAVGNDYWGGGGATLVGSQSDPTSVVATYKLSHKIELTGLTETILEDTEYFVKLTGENGTNAVAGGVFFALRVGIID